MVPRKINIYFLQTNLFETNFKNYTQSTKNIFQVISIQLWKDILSIIFTPLNGWTASQPEYCIQMYALENTTNVRFK